MNEEKANLIKLLEEIYDKFNKNNNDEKNKEIVVEIIAKIIEEICENENVSISSIKKIGYGATSDIFRLGDKIIKIGKYRYTETIPNNPYVVKPLIRRFFSRNNETKNGLFFEVTERVKTFSSIDEVTEDQLFELYSKLRDMGIEWFDIDYRNVGILLKDNTIHWNYNLNPSPSSIMMTGEPTDIVLKKGSLVILDSDWIYKYGEAPPDLFDMDEWEEWCFIKTIRKFRKRYENPTKYFKELEKNKKIQERLDKIDEQIKKLEDLKKKIQKKFNFNKKKK